MAVRLTPAQLAAIGKAARPKAAAPAGKPRKGKRELPPDAILQPRLERYEVTLPDWHPTSLNELTKRGNHYTASTRKRKDAITLGRACRAAGVPAATGKRRVGLTIVLGPKMRGCDGDAYWKSTLDGLQRCKALTGDNRQRCELLPVRFDRGPEKATILTLEDVA